MKKNKKCPETGLLLKLMIICVALSFVMLAIISYDKIINNKCNETCECSK